MTACVVALQSMRSFAKTQYSMTQKAVYFVAVTRSTASRARPGLPTLTFGIIQLPSPRKQATAGGARGEDAAVVERQLTPGLCFTITRSAGVAAVISFSTHS